MPSLLQISCMSPMQRLRALSVMTSRSVLPDSFSAAALRPLKISGAADLCRSGRVNTATAVAIHNIVVLLPASRLHGNWPCDIDMDSPQVLASTTASLPPCVAENIDVEAGIIIETYEEIKG